MKLPYIKITQKNEDFYLTKMKSTDLLDKLNFHFRQSYNDEGDILKIQDFIDKLNKENISIHAEDDGIQRRLQLSRVRKIADYLNNNENSFFPNCVILSVNVNEDDIDNLFIHDDSGSYINLVDSPTLTFQIVDGQHRLAGLFKSSEAVRNAFEVPIVLFINVTKNFCAKIFIDVNGNQAPVNKSVIYDLCELLPNTPEYEETQYYHSICKSLNEDENSPLYKHIKMLGIGTGCISQAFLVDALKHNLPPNSYKNDTNNEIYFSLYRYLKAFQSNFQDYWPVLFNARSVEEFWNHSDIVTKTRKSQILKTNGLGPILKVFPYVYRKLGENRSYRDYKNYISKLIGKIDWCNDEIFTQGTGAKKQEAIKKHILHLLGIDE